MQMKNVSYEIAIKYNQRQVMSEFKNSWIANFSSFRESKKERSCPVQ